MCHVSPSGPTGDRPRAAAPVAGALCKLAWIWLCVARRGGGGRRVPGWPGPGWIWERAGVTSPWVGLGRCWGHLGGRVVLGSCHGVQQGDGGWDGCRRQWGTQRGLGRVRSPRVLALLRWGPRSPWVGGHRCPCPCFQTALITSTLPLPCWGGRAELQLSARAENPIHDPCGILRGCLGTPGPFCPRRHRVPLPPPEISALFYPHHKESPSMAGSRSVTAG